MKKGIVLVIVIAISFFGYIFFSRLPEGDELGTIKIVIVDEEGNQIYQGVHEFDDESSLFDLLFDEFEVGCANYSYTVDETCSTVFPQGHVLLKVEEIETDWYGSYIQIFVNDVPSEYGVDHIMLKDGDVYRFAYVDLGGGSE